ncbi:MAG: L-threonine 3-dehydrogenase [Eubacteriales bacterium]|nr:L-threonine 3-dehydrogenase [Eubacteriales bacterium]
MTGMMDALVKARAGVGLTLSRVPIPQPRHNEVQIKIHKTAICGTDLHIYNWDAWGRQHIAPPLTIGHEYVGEIAELGEEVEGLRVGQRVSGEGHLVCGHCRNCRGGNAQWCSHTLGVGVGRDGAFAEYLCLPASNEVPQREALPEDLVAFFDAYGNATHTALQFDVVGEDLLVTGAGPIGIMAGAICKKNGARQVIITDINEYRLDLARSMGLFGVNVARDDLAAVMRENHMVEGFDVALEMSGSDAALTQILSHMRNGGKIAMLGLFKSAAAIDWNEVVLKGLTLTGVYGRKMYETWYKMVAMVEGGLDLMPLVTHRLPYTEFEKGFEVMNSGRSGKVVLDWRKEQ